MKSCQCKSYTLAGKFAGIVDFGGVDPLTSAGSVDLFLAKYGP